MLVVLLFFSFFDERRSYLRFASYYYFFFLIFVSSDDIRNVWRRGFIHNGRDGLFFFYFDFVVLGQILKC